MVTMIVASMAIFAPDSFFRRRRARHFDRRLVEMVIYQLSFCLRIQAGRKRLDRTVRQIGQVNRPSECRLQRRHRALQLQTEAVELHVVDRLGRQGIEGLGQIRPAPATALDACQHLRRAARTWREADV